MTTITEWANSVDAMDLRDISDVRPGQKLLCCVCETMKDATTMKADLSGEPFKSYYCLSCLTHMKTLQMLQSTVAKQS